MTKRKTWQLYTYEKNALEAGSSEPEIGSSKSGGLWVAALFVVGLEVG